MDDITGDAQQQRVIEQRHIDRALALGQAVVAAAQRRVTAELILGFGRGVEHRAAGGIAAEQRALRAWSRCRRRSEEHTSELQSLMRTSYAVFCLKKKNKLRYISYQSIQASTYIQHQHHR